MSNRGEVSPRVSVLMSVYNDCEYLDDSIRSILRQTYGNFEFLITDDKSEDESIGVIKKYSEKDNRIKVYHNDRNVGLAKSLNQMLKEASGSLVARMDADDISSHDRFERQVNFFDNNPGADVVFANTILIDKDGNEVCRPWRPDEETMLKVLPKHCYIPHPSVMMKKDSLGEVGGYDERYWTGQDKDLWIRMLNKQMSFRYIDDRLVYYRVNPDSIREYASKDYFFTLANKCIWKGSKTNALKYFDKMSLYQKAIITIKLLVPHKIFFLRKANQGFGFCRGFWS